MNWSKKAKSILSKDNSTNKAIVMFSPGHIDVLKNLYQNPNIDGNNVLVGNEDDRKIIEAIKEMEENNMWISSLQANPDCEETQFIAIVWSSLHERISIEHDDDVILFDHDLDEGGNHGLKRAPATNILPSTNNDATMDGRKKQRVGVLSVTTEAASVATPTKERDAPPPRRKSPRRGRGQTTRV